MASVQLLRTPPCLPYRPSRRNWVDPFDRCRLSPTPHQAHELAWRRLDARRRGSRCSRGRGCKLRTARARRRPGAPRNGRTEDTKGGRYLKYRPPLAPLIHPIGIRRSRLGLQASSLSGTYLLCWAAKGCRPWRERDHACSDAAARTRAPGEHWMSAARWRVGIGGATGKTSLGHRTCMLGRDDGAPAIHGVRRRPSLRHARHSSLAFPVAPLQLCCSCTVPSRLMDLQLCAGRKRGCLALLAR